MRRIKLSIGKATVFVLGRTCIWSDKESMGISEVRYKGLEKNRAQVLSLLALANFYRYRHKLA